MLRRNAYKSGKSMKIHILLVSGLFLFLLNENQTIRKKEVLIFFILIHY